MSSPSIDREKHRLRTHFRALRERTPRSVRGSIATSASTRLIACTEWSSAETVALYRAFNSELDLGALDAAARDEGKRVCYPRCAPGQTLAFVPVDDLTFWNAGPFGISEPAGDSLCVSRLDLVVVPLIAFDRRGARLGYGRGYYDRALEGFEGVLAGVAMASQDGGKLPHTDTDVSLTLITTEREVIRPRIREPGEI